MNNTLAAIVVTYNRAGLLIECLAALLAQSRPLARIILIDNASTDATADLLQAHGYFDHPLIDYVRLPVNTGGAGGFHEGVRRGTAGGYDWLWLMDDDAEPAVDAVEKMRKHFARDDVAGIANLPIGLDGKPQVEHRGWLRLRGTTAQAHQPIDATALANGMEISFASFVGLAVHRRAIEKVGLPLKEFFIHRDDLEYCVRLSAVGPLVLATDSLIRHKDAMNSVHPAKVVLGREVRRVPMAKLWLGYYSLRNLIWLRRRHCGAGVAARYAIRQYLRNAVGILLYDSHRMTRLKFFLHASVDGWRGRFDNDKPRRLTAVASR